MIGNKSQVKIKPGISSRFFLLLKKQNILACIDLCSEHCILDIQYHGNS